DDILMAITAENRGPEAAPLHILPHLWFRNTWSWSEAYESIPEIRALGPQHAGDLSEHGAHCRAARAVERSLGNVFFYVEGDAELLFTHNESNAELLWGTRSRTPWVKDAFHARVVHGAVGRVNPEQRGTKMAAWRRFLVPAGGRARILVRLSPEAQPDPFE